jgi:hypothetical protein
VESAIAQRLEKAMEQGSFEILCSVSVRSPLDGQDALFKAAVDLYGIYIH